MAVALCPAMLVLAAVGTGRLSEPALAAATTIAPSGVITGRPVHSRPPSPGRGRRIVRLHVLDPSAYAQAKRAAALRAGRTRSAATSGAPRLAHAGSTGAINVAVFGSLNEAGLSAAAQIEARGEAGDVTPPDTTGAIGPSHYVEIVNSEIAAYRRSSLEMIGSPVSLEDFTGGTEICDPQIKYDPQSERWFYVAIRCDLKAETLYMGFSKTRDPGNFSTGEKGGWCGYAYSTGADLEDYPKLGLDPQHIIIGTNSFRIEPREEFVTAHILSAPKPASGKIESCPPEAPALSAFGSAEKKLTTTVGHKAFTPEPATVADGSSTGYVVAADLVPPRMEKGKNIMIWRIGGSAEAPELEPLDAPEVTAYEIPPAIPQPGSSDEIDSLDGRLTQAVAAPDPSAGGAEAVWTQHTVAGGAGSVVRWYELLPGNAPKEAKVRQLGTIAEMGKYVFNGAIAPTRSGGAVIDYNTGSASALVQIMAQSRRSYAPRGTMNSPVLLGESSAIDADFSCPSQSLGELFEAESCRWGDYAGASVDPEDPNLVWGSSQLNGPADPEHTAQWASRNFALEANDAPPDAAFTAAPDPVRAGDTVTFDGSSSSDPDGTVTSYSWSFGDGTTAAGPTASHAYAAPGTYEVKLTVIDNAGNAGSVAHSVTVEAPAAGTQATTTSSLSPPFASAPPAPDSSFSIVRRSVNHLTGSVTFTVSVHNAGHLSWLLTFQNGLFAVFAARTATCKKGKVRLRGRCRPARIVFARGSRTVADPGRSNFTVKPGASALKALRTAARRGRSVPVRVTLTFQSALGGVPVAHARTVVVKLKSKR